MITSRKGFTLLELTISMLVVSMLMITLVVSLQAGFKARDVSVNAAITDRQVELVMESIRNDVQSSLPPTRGTFQGEFEGLSNPNGDGFDDLDFFTTSPASVHMMNGGAVANGDIKEIEITAYQPPGSNDRVLVRRTWNNLLDPNYQPQYMQRNLEYADEEVLCRHVVALTIQYYDLTSTQSWLQTWDSTTSTPVNTLPTAVQIQLQVQSPEKLRDGTNKVVTYTRIYQLPCIGASNDPAPVGTSTDGSTTGATQ